MFDVEMRIKYFDASLKAARMGAALPTAVIAASVLFLRTDDASNWTTAHTYLSISFGSSALALLTIAFVTRVHYETVLELRHLHAFGRHPKVFPLSYDAGSLGKLSIKKTFPYFQRAVFGFEFDFVDTIDEFERQRFRAIGRIYWLNVCAFSALAVSLFSFVSEKYGL
ncbi:hypothetical protein [uncultured Tateyamaria sp.]|uniref:hypothetical protein n=1 Tax=Tateyamaria sp. 1078 TaxID=3417464 RepID=UPI002626BEDE|nr:hypothetical protein [uncultured Tateyamaria sp.]